jgi:4-hydroxybenzoate polyprenyltransferase
VLSNVFAAVYVGIGGSLFYKSQGEWFGIALLCFFAVLVYCGGMFLNDFFDAAYDAANQRLAHRPIPSGRVSRSTVGVMGFAQLLLGLAVYMIGYGALQNGAPSYLGQGSAFLLVCAVVIYDAYHKKNPLSPLLMASCRSLLYLSVALFFASQISVWLYKLVILNFVYLVGLTAIAKSEGKIRHHYSSALQIFFCALLPSLMILFEMPVVTALLFGVFISVLCLLLSKKPSQIGQTVAKFIAGICILDGLVVYSVSGSVLLFLSFLALFFCTLSLQRFVQGT